MNILAIRRPVQPSPRAGIRGFTLIELLVTVTILGILTAVAAPSLRGFIAAQQVRNASYDISSMLVLARSEAIKRNTNVVVTPTSTSWTSGWSVVAATTTIAQREAFPTGLTITGPASVSYNGTGRLNAAVTAFSVSKTGTSRTATINIDLSGLPKSVVTY